MKDIQLETESWHKSQFLLNCTDLNTTQLKSINTARSVAGTTCTLIITLILLHILCTRAFGSVLQRLFLYLVLATIAQEALIAVSFEHQFQYPHQSQFCIAYGFFIQWSGVVMFNFALAVMLHILYLIYVQLKGEPFPRLSRSRCGAKIAEILCVLFILCFPLTYLWIPFLHGNYGLSGASCWMRALDENCKNVGLADQIIFAYGAYEGVGAVAILVTVVMVIVYCKIARVYPDARRLIQRTLLLMVFLFAYIIIISIPLAVRLQAGITGVRQHFILWITWAITIPISHTVFIFGFLFSFNCGLSRLRKAGNSFRNCNSCAKCCCFKRETRSRGTKRVIPSLEQKTTPPSDRVTAPSQSYFSVPYTDGFTDACGDNTPLMLGREGDTGYSSSAELSKIT